VDEARLHVEPDLAQALETAVGSVATGRLFVLPTYTALLELQSLLAAQGHTRPFWEETPT
jgi:hypothetical protein